MTRIFLAIVLSISSIFMLTTYRLCPTRKLSSFEHRTHYGLISFFFSFLARGELSGWLANQNRLKFARRIHAFVKWSLRMLLEILLPMKDVQYNQEKMRGQRGRLMALAGICHVRESYF